MTPIARGALPSCFEQPLPKVTIHTARVA